MSTLLNKIKSLFETKASHEQFIDSAHSVQELEHRMRSLGTLNMNLLYMSRC